MPKQDGFNTYVISAWLSPKWLFGNSSTWAHDVCDVKWASSLYIKTVGKVLLYMYMQGLCWKLKAASSNHPVLVTVVLLLFKLENKKGLHKEVNKCQWSALRVFNWQDSKSYIMPQPTDLFCHTVSFTKFNIVNKP